MVSADQGQRQQCDRDAAGHELTKIAIAVAISLPANQSATIFVIWTLSRTPPAPPSNRPAIWHAPGVRYCHREVADQHQRQRRQHSRLVAELSADRAARQRQRNAGVKYKPIRSPMSARLTPKSRPSREATAATL